MLVFKEICYVLDITDIFDNRFQSAVLHIGNMYHYYPKTVFQVFSQQIFLLNFLRHAAQSLPPTTNAL